MWSRFMGGCVQRKYFAVSQEALLGEVMAVIGRVITSESGRHMHERSKNRSQEEFYWRKNRTELTLR